VGDGLGKECFRMLRRTRIAVVGLGRIGRIHATNLAHGCASADLVCVVDADAETGRRLAGELGVASTASLAELLADDSVDAVVIATPTGTHSDLVITAARAGKHVFCEKPVALDRPATLAALEAAREADVRLQVGFQRRFDPDCVAVHERLAAGELGTPYLFRMTLRDMASPTEEFLRGSGGFFLDVTIHTLDVARWLIGEVAEVSAYGAALSDPVFAHLGDVDTAVVVLRFENGALGVIDNSRSAGYGYECYIEILGSRATARIENPPHHHYEWLSPAGAVHLLPQDFEQRYRRAYIDELESFAACVRDGLSPRVSGADALAAFDLAVAADSSWRTGRTVHLKPGWEVDGTLNEPGTAPGRHHDQIPSPVT
jgi:inositol 2-dehydrogenase